MQKIALEILIRLSGFDPFATDGLSYKAALYSDSTCTTLNSGSVIIATLQSCVVGNCGGTFFKTTTCAPTATAPTLAPAMSYVQAFPGSATTLSAGSYGYIKTYYDSSCSQSAYNTITTVNTCIPALGSEYDPNSFVTFITSPSRLGLAPGVKQAYKKVLGAYDSSANQIYLNIVYYSDSACTSVLNTGSNYGYQYVHVTPDTCVPNPILTDGSYVKIGKSADTSILPHDGQFTK
jgi:hypothetical protein